MNRRAFLGTTAAALAVAGKALAGHQQPPAPARKGRLKQGVTRGVFGRGVALEDCCRQAASVGIQGFDLVTPTDWPLVKKYGLVPSMASGGGGSIASALNRTENHAKIEAAMRTMIDQAAESGVPNLITFSGNRAGMSDAEGADNCVAFLNKVKAQAEDKGVTICMEYLNSKVNHKDYMFDHFTWGVDVMKRVNSPRVKILFDIYHAQIMDGDIVAEHPRQLPVDRPLPHWRQPGPPRDRRHAGAELPLRDAGHRGSRVHRLRHPRVLAGRGARSDGEPQESDGDLHCLKAPSVVPAPGASRELRASARSHGYMAQAAAPTRPTSHLTAGASCIMRVTRPRSPRFLSDLATKTPRADRGLEFRRCTGAAGRRRPAGIHLRQVGRAGGLRGPARSPRPDQPGVAKGGFDPRWSGDGRNCST